MNPRRILLILARLLAFAVVAETIAIWIFWRSSWTPIERHYLPAYIWCSLPVISLSTVEVRLIWKTGRHRKRELATDDDAVDSDSGTGMELSRSAIEAGWKTLIEGPPQQIPAELLRPGLASLAFEGQRLWDLLLLPELYALAVLLVALFVWFSAIGFLRALLAEYGWRRRLSSRQQLLSSLFRDSKVLARRARAGFAALHRSASQLMEKRRISPSMIAAAAQSPTRRASFAFPLFGVYSKTGEGYLWSERDEIL